MTNWTTTTAFSSSCAEAPPDWSPAPACRRETPGRSRCSAGRTPPGLLHAIAEMRRHHRVRRAAQRMPGRQRLAVKHIQRRNDPPRGPRRATPPRRRSARARCSPGSPHVSSCQVRRAEQPARPWRQHQMDADHIGGDSNSPLLTMVAPAAAAFSAVRFWLQPITFMPSALP